MTSLRQFEPSTTFHVNGLLKVFLNVATGIAAVANAEPVHADRKKIIRLKVDPAPLDCARFPLLEFSQCKPGNEPRGVGIVIPKDKKGLKTK